jgi:indole-3-acetate monooxygenase
MHDKQSAVETVRFLLDEIRKLAPDIASRGTEFEARRRLPSDVMEALRSIGVFGLFAPRSHGGLELELPWGLEIIRSLGRIDSSVGWNVMTNAVATLFASRLPRETYDQIYESCPDVIISGSAQPAGTAERTAGGWRISGRWPFASGCQYANWMMAVCVVIEGGKPVPGPSGDGQPMLRGFVLPAKRWQIEDTWHVSGLKGTGSHHITLTDTVVPAANFFDVFAGPSCLPGPLYQAVQQLIPLAHAAIDLGIAEGALDAIVELANAGRRQQRSTIAMRDTEIFQGELGRAAADLAAAQALLHAQAASHWRHALAGTLMNETLLTQGTQAAIWIAATCVRAANSCFALGGGSAVYDTSPLQRRLRDLQTAAQHTVVQQRHYVSAGKLLLDSALASGPRTARPID